MLNVFTNVLTLSLLSNICQMHSLNQEYSIIVVLSGAYYTQINCSSLTVSNKQRISPRFQIKSITPSIICTVYAERKWRNWIQLFQIFAILYNFCLGCKLFTNIVRLVKLTCSKTIYIQQPPNATFIAKYFVALERDT